MVAVADSAEGLSGMLKDLAKYCERNKVEVNTRKTKIMVFRNGGKRMKKERWVFNGEELEVVDSYKYLGYWFTTGNTDTRHVEKMAIKVRKTINMAWGLAKRARVNLLSKKLYLMDAIVKAGCLYGVENWGWKRYEAIERVQALSVKMLMKVSKNTPGYIWRAEAERRSYEVETLKRAGDYLRTVLDMKEGRWPLACLREEARNISNGNPSRWGKEVVKALAEVGDGEAAKLSGGKDKRERLGANLEKGYKTKMDQEIQLDWERIKKSKFNRNYGAWKEVIGREKYWEEKELSEETKIQWARLRCGSIGKGYGKGHKSVDCSVCRAEEEKIEHIWVCHEATKRIQRELMQEIKELGLEGMDEVVGQRLIGLLKERPVKALCLYSKEFEKLSREKKGCEETEGSTSQQSGE